jgi:DNA-binding SARP family transcriptional activator
MGVSFPVVHEGKASTVSWGSAPFGGAEQRRVPGRALPASKRSAPATNQHRVADRDATVDEAPLPTASVNAATLVSDLATLGLCCMGSVAIGRRLWLRRHRSDRTNDELGPWVPDDRMFQLAAVAIDALQFEGEQLAPSIRLVRVGPDGFEFFLGTRVDWAPPGLHLDSNGTSWIMSKEVAMSSISGPATDLSACRILVPVGSDVSNSWGVVIESGTSVAVLGPNADELVASFVAPIYRPPWSERVRARSESGRVLLTWTEAGSAAQEAQITTRQTDRADLTIVVDEHAATIHPRGVTFTPLRQRSQEPTPSHVLDEAKQPHGLSVGHSEQPLSGLVEVKLLSSIPWIEGLANPLPPKRARRVVELLAYLAIHQPDPVSGDRLRTRVLGTSDADAAAKTLFNTVGAARRALGLDPTGSPYLPSASRHGHYKLSTLVGVDVVRALDLFELAKGTDSSEAALAFYRSGLDLVNGEPLAGVLSGYAWWRAEGHEARITTAVVEAANKAVHLAIANEFFDITTWLLERARLLDPYSEVLSRAAMTAAAASGDQTRLHREWNECVRRVRELDPEGVPSAESYRLFNRLINRSDGVGPYANLAAIEEAP